jgi:hypothetical protein
METARFEVRLVSARLVTIQQAMQLWLDRGLPWGWISPASRHELSRVLWWEAQLELTNLPPHLNPHDLATDHPRFLLQALADADPSQAPDEAQLALAQECRAPWVYELRHEPLPLPEGWIQGTRGRATVRLAVPQELAPTLASRSAWTTTAEPAPSEAWRWFGHLKGPHRAEVRPLYPARVHHFTLIREWPRRDGVSRDHRQGLLSWSLPCFIPAPGGELLLQNTQMVRLNPSGAYGSFDAPHFPKGKRLRRCSVYGGGFDPSGKLWLLTDNGLAEHLGEGTWSLTTKKEGLPSNDLRALAWRGDQLVLATAAGLALRQPDGSWKVIAKGLADKDCRHVTVDRAGTLWTLGSKGLSKLAPDDTITTFKKRQDPQHDSFLALPSGALLLAGDEGLCCVRPGGKALEPLAWLREALPGPLRALALGPDGAVWALPGYGRLVRLKEGEPVKVYAFQDTLLTYPSSQSDLGSYSDHLGYLCAHEGGVWLGTNSLLWISHEALREADAAPPLHLPPSGAVLVPPWPA